MPTPVPFNAPGQWGVNEQEKDQLLHPNWATVADGLMLNDASRLQCRGGLTVATSAGASAEILRQFVYVDTVGTEILLSTTATKILKGSGDLTDVANEIASASTPTNGYWKFDNFNGKVVGWQAGHTPIVWSGTGDFANIAVNSGTQPDGDAMVAAFGRIWAVDDDGQTIRISALLDETRWATADGGASIDMRNVWTQGMDRVTAIAAFGSNLVIFGRKHIIFYSDGQGSAVGVDPTQMYVVDTLEGTGCVARDTVTAIGEGDLVFLSDVGLQSLRRLVIQKDNPLAQLSWQIGDRLAGVIQGEVVSTADLRTFTGAYHAFTGQYILVHTTNEDVFVFHTTARTEDEKGRELVPITIWDTSILANIRSFLSTRTGAIYTSGGASNHIYTYSEASSKDFVTTAIAVNFESGWVKTDSPEFDQPVKALKFAQVTILNSAGISSALTFKYGMDYAITLDTLAAPAADEARIVNIYDPTGDIEGQYIKFGVSDPSFGKKVLQQISLYVKAGRTAFIHTKLGETYDNTSINGPRLLLNGNPLVTGSPVTTTAGQTSATFTDIPIPTDSDGAIIVVTLSKVNGGTVSANVGAVGALDLFGLQPPTEGAVSTLFAGAVYFGGVAPSTQTLVVTTTLAFATGTVVTAYVYPLKGIGATVSNTDYDETTSAALTLTLTLPTVNNSIFAISYQDGAAGMVTHDSTILKFLDSRVYTGFGGSNVFWLWIATDVSATAFSTIFTYDLIATNDFSVYVAEIPRS